MGFPKAAILSVIFGSLVAFSAASVGWAQQQPPRPRQDQQSAPLPMWPGMMGGQMMGGMMGSQTMGPQMMDQMNQMMQLCSQMMGPMMGQTRSSPSSPEPAPRTN